MVAVPLGEEEEPTLECAEELDWPSPEPSRPSVGEGVAEDAAALLLMISQSQRPLPAALKDEASAQQVWFARPRGCRDTTARRGSSDERQ
eukprot:scaffold84545_cov30-Tisochrysis_lutea.AAC.1